MTTISIIKLTTRVFGRWATIDGAPPHCDRNDPPRTTRGGTRSQSRIQVGFADGPCVGLRVGDDDGFLVVGLADGALVVGALVVGLAVGTLVVGLAVGLAVGLDVVGLDVVGLDVVGLAVGESVVGVN